MQKNDISNPLVSIVVVTYNSSKTIIETLDSIKVQTYSPIELIISDDNSSDRTVQICSDWMEKNKNRFVSSQIVTVGKNTGVSGNMNRGIRVSRGKWIKTIAGDDTLISSAIEDYINFIQKSSEDVRICVCDVDLFTSEGVVSDDAKEEYKRFFKLAHEQYDRQRKRVMTTLVFVGPTYFYSRELYDEVGGFSEQYGNAEEWPFVYKIIMKGNRIFVIDKKLVRYRVQASSLCHVGKGELVSKSVFMGMYHHFFNCSVKDLIRDGRPLVAWHFSLSFWSRRLQYGISNRKLRNAIRAFLLMFSPLTYKKALGISGTL